MEDGKLELAELQGTKICTWAHLVSSFSGPNYKIIIISETNSTKSLN